VIASDLWQGWRVDQFVSRPELFERLSAVSPGAVALACAPAGSGKTVLLRSWAEQLEEPVSWVTIDRAESDAQRFWSHTIDALADAVGDEAIERAHPAPNFAGMAVLDRLLEQLGDLAEPATLVIDDLHELHSDEALRLLDLLLAHRPAQLRVVLGTREEPALALHRLRLAGELSELRADDLRFSLDEMRALLGASGVALSDSALQSLYERTEGWPAGLRLAAISLAGHPDPDRFVAEFSGSERTVAGYLLAEVLERQPPEVRDLLLRTSILDRISGPLADELTGQPGSEAILQRLEDQNAFVTSLDAGRTRFRYHHLFADLLQLELRRTAPEAVQSLHRVAADWYERQGDVIAAIRHSQAAEQWADAGRLLLDNYVPLTIAGRSETLHALLEACPKEVRRSCGDVALALSADAMVHGLSDAAAADLSLARSLAPEIPEDRRSLFDIYLAVASIELARRRGDLTAAEAAMEDLETAIGSAAGTVAPDYRALAMMNLGIAEMWAARPDAARRHLDDALASAHRIPFPFVEVGCLAHLALLAPLSGEPMPRALELGERAIAIAEERGWTRESMTTGAFAAAGMALALMGRMGEAERQLERADEALRVAGDPATEVVLRQARGLLRFAQNQLAEAAAEFTQARGLERLLASGHVLASHGRCRSVQLQIRLGQLDAARRALDEFDEKERGSAGARISEAALKLASDEPEAVETLLAPVVDGSSSAAFARAARIEALLLSATAHDALGDHGATERSVEAALDVAESDALILPFAIWGKAELLERHPRHRSAHGALLATILDTLAGSGPGAPVVPLRDELSEAELRVLRYLPSNLSAVEIANELYVSANTVRTHMRHIYQKLDAHSRSEAVARARELGLAAPGALRRAGA
jgi:LuxR family transcriptional regulator, maltose regulon positive regulatory protein